MSSTTTGRIGAAANVLSGKTNLLMNSSDDSDNVPDLELVPPANMRPKSKFFTKSD